MGPLTLKQAADYLGESEQVLYRRLQTGEIPAWKNGHGRGHWRVRKAALDEFINKQEQLHSAKITKIDKVVNTTCHLRKTQKRVNTSSMNTSMERELESILGLPPSRSPKSFGRS